MNAQGKSGGLGQLEDGYMVKCSLATCRRLLSPKYDRFLPAPPCPILVCLSQLEYLAASTADSSHGFPGRKPPFKNSPFTVYAHTCAPKISYTLFFGEVFLVPFCPGLAACFRAGLRLPVSSTAPLDCVPSLCLPSTCADTQSSRPWVSMLNTR